MISCRDVNNLQMDGMERVAGAAGLDRIVDVYKRQVIYCFGNTAKRKDCCMTAEKEWI